MKRWHHLSVYPILYCTILFSCLTIACNKEASEFMKVLSQQLIGKWKVVSFKDADIEQIGSTIDSYELLFEKDSLHVSTILFTNKNSEIDSTTYSVNDGSEKVTILMTDNELDEWGAFLKADTLLLELSNCCNNKLLKAVKK